MLSCADLHDPAALLSLRAEALAHGACQPPIDYLTRLYRRGGTLAEALDDCALTREGRAWCLWCRKTLAGALDAELCLYFTRAGMDPVLAVIWTFQPPLDLSPAERWHLLTLWHSATGAPARRRPATERKLALS